MVLSATQKCIRVHCNCNCVGKTRVSAANSAGTWFLRVSRPYLFSFRPRHIPKGPNLFWDYNPLSFRSCIIHQFFHNEEIHYHCVCS